MSDGVLDERYARSRRKSRVLKYRYKARAWEAYQAMRQYAAPRPSYRVLDLGAAEGSTLLELRRLLGGAGEFVGIEASRSLLASAPVLPADTRLLLGDAQDPPAEVEDDSFDLVSALAVLEHLPNPEHLVAAARRKLRSGGVFVATCPHPTWDHVAGRLGLVRDDSHIQEMDRERLTQLGLVIGEVHYRPFMLAVTGVLPYFGISVSPELSATVDALVARLPWTQTRHVFVNQVMVAVKR